jgi:nucleoside-diphosphate-sugar epimerase
MKILLTGATGFLGSHIAEELIENGHDLILTKRQSSNLWRCESFVNKVYWVNTDSKSWIKETLKFCPEIIINSAWNGVSAGNREEWGTQVENINFQQQLLELASNVKLKRFIGIGSQAEYGEFHERIDETFLPNPSTAYGATKLAASIILSTFCNTHQIGWYWFRLFSCFGERESENWLIPATIKNILTKDSMDLTPGEQEYSYMYIKDVARFILTAVESTAQSGIYHIAADKCRTLKEILNFIKDYLNPQFKLNFGALPYRIGQSMINASFIDKTTTAFGKIDPSDFKEKLIQTIEYYKQNINNEKK